MKSGDDALSVAKKIEKTDLDKESDVDLLTYISWRHESEDEASRAFGVFYERYFKLLVQICMRRFKRQIGEHGVEDLVNDTFLQVFKGSASKFQTHETDPAKQRHQIGAWLGQIAFNLFRMQLRGQKRRIVICDLPEGQMLEDFGGFDKENPPMSTERAEQCKKIQEFLEDLRPREREILLTRLANYHRAGGKQQFHPDNLERLANDFGITKDNVRQIHHRTLQKLKTELS